MRIFSLVAACAASLLSPIVSPALAQSREIEAPDGPYVHRSVEISFPAEIGEFERGRIVEFNDQGSDASVGYRMTSMPGEISLYVFPSPEPGSTCSSHHEGAKQAILSRNGVVRAGSPDIFMPGFDLAQQVSSTYDIPAGGYGFDHPPLVSYLWIGCVPGSNYLVKYRGSFFASQEDRARGIAAKLFSQIDWKPLAKLVGQ